MYPYIEVFHEVGSTADAGLFALSMHVGTEARPRTTPTSSRTKTRRHRRPCDDDADVRDRSIS
jgi:hypothetical protein